MAMLMWVLLHEIIDQDTQEDEPQKDECPRRRRPLGRGLEPRKPWCVVDPAHDRRLKTLSEEEIARRRNAEGHRARIKRAKRTLAVVAWSVLTVAVFYFTYVRPMVFPEAYQVWLEPPRLGDFNPESIGEIISSILWLVLDMMIFMLPVFIMLILSMLIFRGWKLDELSKER